MNKINIAIDAMGGDHGLSVVIPASILAIKENPKLKLILVGDEKAILSHLRKQKYVSNPQIEVVHASEVVTMDELPSQAMRNKKDSSMRVAINLVKQGRAQACVSAGNTGALMATARFVLKTLPGIDRPAIIASLPSLKGTTRVIDLGANVDSCAEHLFQFAIMGSVLIKAVENIDDPSVGLLNIGVEEIKGNDQVKRTAHMLAENKILNYVGYVEGDAIYSGEVNLVVCDGFVGNVALKASEGIAKLLMSFVKDAFSHNIFTKIAAIAAMPVLKRLKKRMDPSNYNGASMVGLNGIVVKSHGGTNVLGFHSAIREAVLEVENNITDLVRDRITELINEGLLA